MPCTEAYREHIMYTFNGFCKTVIRYAALNAWRDRSRRRQKEISLEYLTEEKFYHLGTTDEYFEAPYEEHPITICGQTIILTNGKLAAALLSLPEYDRVSNPQDFAVPAKENGGAFAWRIRIAAIENGHIDRDTEDSIKQRLVAALFKFRFDGQALQKNSY